MIDHIVSDFLTRLMRGQSVNSEEVLDRHPQFRTRLTKRLKFVERIAKKARLGKKLIQVKSPSCDAPSFFIPDDSQFDIATMSRCVSPQSDDVSAKRAAKSRSTTSRNQKCQASKESLPPTQVGRFAIEQQVGEGGFGTVYRAYDPRLERVVAIKIPRPGKRPIAESKRQFWREAKLTASLNHPGIVPIFEVGMDHRVPYLVTEFVDGRSLSQMLSVGEISIAVAIDVVVQTAQALEYAHQQRVVHRDIKPGNLLVDQCGRVRITDFGLAYRTDEPSDGKDLVLVGTPQFIAPEKVSGGVNKIDGRVDVFGLGVVLYRLLSGVFPFRGSQDFTIHQILFHSPPSPSKLNPSIDKGLDSICMKALAKSRNQRFTTAGEFAEALMSWRDSGTKP